MIENQIASLDAGQPPMSDAAFDEGLQRLQAAMGSRRGRRPKLLVAAAAAAACLIGGVVAVGHHRPADSAAADVLNAAAAQLRVEPTLQPKHGQFVYQRVDFFNKDTPGTEEYWIPADTGAHERVCVTDGGCTDLPYRPQGAKDQGLPYDALNSLPTTGSAMLEYLRTSPIAAFQRSSGWSADRAVWNTALQLGDLFPPAQEAALFQALTQLHEVRLEGQVTTFDGRDGVAIGFKDPSAGTAGSTDPVIHNQLVFATDTHEYIGERSVQKFSSGASVSFNDSRTKRAIVNRVGDRP